MSLNTSITGSSIARRRLLGDSRRLLCWSVYLATVLFGLLTPPQRRHKPFVAEPARFSRIAGAAVYGGSIPLARALADGSRYNQSVLTAGFGSGSTLSVASRTSDGQTIIAYLSDGNATAKTINMSAITSTSSTAIAWWYAPLTGVATLIGTFPNSGSQSFTAPNGNDWVLVIDDAAANLGAPGGGTGNNPVPSIASLSPASATAGGPAFTLTVNGSGFIHKFRRQFQWVSEDDDLRKRHPNKSRYPSL